MQKTALYYAHGTRYRYITRAVRAKFRCGVGSACHFHAKGFMTSWVRVLY